MFSLKQSLMMLGILALSAAPAFAAEAPLPPAPVKQTLTPATPPAVPPTNIPPQPVNDALKTSLNSIHEQLDLTKDQEVMWAKFLGVVEENHKAYLESTKGFEPMAPASSQNTLDFLDRRDLMMKTRMEAAHKLRAVFDPFYKSLNTKQKNFMDKYGINQLVMFL